MNSWIFGYSLSFYIFLCNKCIKSINRNVFIDVNSLVFNKFYSFPSILKTVYFLIQFNSHNAIIYLLFHVTSHHTMSTTICTLCTSLWLNSVAARLETTTTMTVTIKLMSNSIEPSRIRKKNIQISFIQFFYLLSFAVVLFTMIIWCWCY